MCSKPTITTFNGCNDKFKFGQETANMFPTNVANTESPEFSLSRADILQVTAIFPTPPSTARREPTLSWRERNCKFQNSSRCTPLHMSYHVTQNCHPRRTTPRKETFKRGLMFILPKINLSRFIEIFMPASMEKTKLTWLSTRFQHHKFQNKCAKNDKNKHCWGREMLIQSTITKYNKIVLTIRDFLFLQYLPETDWQSDTSPIDLKTSESTYNCHRKKYRHKLWSYK